MLTIPDPSKKYELIIRDINGKKVDHQNIQSAEQVSIALNELKGVYFIELISEDAIYVDKIVGI